MRSGRGSTRTPNVVVCRSVRTLQGVPTAFCEWINGASLRESIRDGSLYEGPAEEVESRLFDIARQAAQALRHVHGQGLVHCDVKPGNLLISRDRAVRLNDFGLATRCAKQGEAEHNDRAPGCTPAYCPAEQAQGRPPKPWKDEYAWALTVLEMYLGERCWSTGAEAKEAFDGYPSACRVPLPEDMAKLLRLCLKWKVNDGSVVVKELERMTVSHAGTAEKPASAETQETMATVSEEPMPPEAPKAPAAKPDPREESPKKSFFARLFGRRKGR